MLGSYWGHVGVMLVSCWSHVGVYCCQDSVRLGSCRVLSESCRGHVRVKSNVGGYGTVSKCVTFLVVFEAETGFSVLFFKAFVTQFTFEGFLSFMDYYNM